MSEEHFNYEYVSQDEGGEIFGEEQAVERLEGEEQLPFRSQDEEEDEPQAADEAQHPAAKDGAEQDAQDEQDQADKAENDAAAAKGVDSLFSGDNGSFDTGKFSKFVEVKPAQYAPPKFSPDAEANAQRAKEQEELNIYDRLYNEVKEERSKIKNAAFMWKNYFSEAASKGMNSDQAMMFADQRLERDINAYISEMEERKRFDYMKERENNEMSKKLSKREQKEINARSRSNFLDLANQYGGMDNISAAIYNEQIGWPVMQFLYDLSNPDKSNLTPQQYQDAVINNTNRILADRNKAAVFMDLIHAKTTRQVLPKLIKASKSQKQTTQRGITRAQTPPPRQAGAQAASAPAAAGGFSSWLGETGA